MKKSFVFWIFTLCIFSLSSMTQAAGTWNLFAGATPGDRHLHGMAYDYARQVTVLYGGDTFIIYPTSMWIFNGTIWQEETPLNTPPDGRVSPGFCYTVLNQPGYENFTGFILFGGWNFSLGYLGDTWFYDTGTLQWQMMTSIWSGCSDMPEPREGHGLVYNPVDEIAILFGGKDGGIYFNDLWILDTSIPSSGCPWQERFPAVSPFPRAFHGMCYDFDRGVVVLFGGDGPVGAPPYTKFRDTWEYNFILNTWNQINCTSHPDYLEKMAISYDSQYQKVILFGGRTPDEKSTNEKAFYNETWEYDPSIYEWVYIDTDTQPSQRYETTMDYDQARNVHVLHAGQNAGFTLEEDTWEYQLYATPLPTVTPLPLPATNFSGNLGILAIFSAILILFSIRRIN